MRIVYYGEGDPAWVEPETPEEEKWVEENKHLTLMQIIAQIPTMEKQCES